MDREVKIWLAVLVTMFIALLVWGSFAPAYAQTGQQPQPAQQVCGPRREMIDALRKQYGEEERWFGIATAKSPTVLLLLVSKAGTWTMLRVQPDVACAGASGEDSTLMFGTPA